jgi:hypothetical protein
MAGDILVADVEARANINGVDMRVTDIEVSRNVGPSANKAIIKGIADDIEEFEVDQSVTARINNGLLFTGKIDTVTENEKGIATVTAYDHLLDIQNKQVRLNINEPREAYNVLQDLLQDAGFTVVNDYQSAVGGPITQLVAPDLDFQSFLQGPTELTSVPIYMEPKSQLPAGDTKITNGFGSGKRGEPLSSAIKSLVKEINGVVWCDSQNVIRIETYPQHRTYRTPYIIKLESGEDSNNTQRVVVKGGTPTGDLGPAAANMYSQVSHTSIAEFTDRDDGEERTLQDQNVITQQGTNAVANSEFYRSERSVDPGEITLVGNTSVELFDNVTIPDIEDAESLGGLTYTIKGIQHTVNAQDGFRTKLTLSPEPLGTFESYGGPGARLATVFTERIADGRLDEGTLSLIRGYE